MSRANHIVRMQTHAHEPCWISGTMAIRLEHDNMKGNDLTMDRYAMSQDNLVRYFYT